MAYYFTAHSMKPEYEKPFIINQDDVAYILPVRDAGKDVGSLIVLKVPDQKDNNKHISSFAVRETSDILAERLKVK